MVVIGVVNYGAGNFSSVVNAFQYLGIRYVEITKSMDFKEATHIVLPGVGTFSKVMDRLKCLDLINGLYCHINSGKPFLGICVGMQILASFGMEFNRCSGLNLIEGVVDKIGFEGNSLRLPHIGWNEVQQTRESILYKNMQSPIFYFVHSFAFYPTYNEHISSTVFYGSAVVASVEKNNIFGVQFHPEKSQHNGLQLLRNFAEVDIC